MSSLGNIWEQPSQVQHLRLNGSLSVNSIVHWKLQMKIFEQESAHKYVLLQSGAFKYCIILIGLYQTMLAL